MSVLVETGHLNEYPFNHARILYGNVATAVTATGAATNFPASAVLLDTTYERWKPSVSGDSITLTFPQQNINAIALSAHSDMVPTIEVRTAGGVFEEVVAYPFDGSTLESNFAEQEYALLDYSPDNQALLLLIKDRFADAVRITLTYSGTAPTLGNVRVGNVLEMQRPFYQGHQPAILAPDSVVDPNISESGEWLGASQTRQGFSLRFAWENLKAPWVRKNWVPFAQYLKTRPYVIAWNPEQFPADCFYASSSQVPKPNNSGPLNYQSISLSGRGYSDGTDAVVENLGPSTFDEQYTFTRSSGATETTISGTLREVADDVPRFEYDPVTGEALGLLIEEQRTNEFQYPRRFDNAYWSKTRSQIQPNIAVSPDGNLTGLKLIEDDTASNTHFLSRTVSVSSGATISEGIFVRAGERTVVQLQENTSGASVTADLSSGVVTAGTGGLKDVGGGWFILSLTATVPGTSAIFALYLSNGVSTTYTGDGTSGAFVWHSQIEQATFLTSTIPDATTFTSRSTTATFYDSNGVLQTAAIDVARDDAYGWFDGVLYPIGLLLEQAATNFLLHSDNYADASWSKTNITITSDDISGPFGGTLADKIEATASASTNNFQDGVGAGDATNGNVGSVYVKQGSGTTDANRFLLRNQTTATNLYLVELDYSTGEFVTESGTGAARVKVLGNGWYKVEIYATSGISASDDIRLYVGFTGSSETAGEFLYAWNAQVESGTYGTSDIITASTTVTRAADVSSSPAATREADDCVRTLGSEFNPEAWTVYVRAKPVDDFTVRRGLISLLAVDGDTDDSIVVALGANGEIRAAAFENGALLFATSAANTNVTDPAKVALRFDGTTFQVYAGGEAVISNQDVTLSLSQKLAVLAVGKYATNPGYLNGTAEDARVYARALTAAELQELTAP